MHFSIVHRARGSLAFQLVLEDGSVAVTGTPQADVEACTQVIREVVMVLREGGGAVHGAKAGHRVTLTGELGTALAESVTFASAAEAEALLARVRGEVTADSQIRVTFPPEQRAMNQSQTDLAVAIRYDLEETSKTRRSGLEPIRRTRDNLYSAHFNDASGERRCCSSAGSPAATRATNRRGRWSRRWPRPAATAARTARAACTSWSRRATVASWRAAGGSRRGQSARR
jgi:hypothetical protein